MNSCIKDVCYVITRHLLVKEILIMQYANRHWYRVCKHQMALKFSTLIHLSGMPYLDCYKLEEQDRFLYGSFHFVQTMSQMQNLRCLSIYYLPLVTMFNLKIKTRIVSLSLVDLGITSGVNEEWAQRLSLIFPDLTELSINCYRPCNSRMPLLYLSQNLCGIRKLKLDFSTENRNLSDEVCKELIGFRSLTNLSMNFVFRRVSFKSFCVNGLIHLELSYPLQDACLVELTQVIFACKSLRSLSIVSYSSKSLSVLSWLASHLQSLKIECQELFLDSGNFFSNLISSLKPLCNLIQLSISVPFVYNLGSHVSLSLIGLEHFTQLRQFEAIVPQIPNILQLDACLKQIVNKCKRLTYFRWNNQIKVF